jgi:subtilisin family serine protease
MPTPQQRVAAAIRFFFERALPQATGKTIAGLASPSVHVGAYAKHAGGPVASAVGQTVTPSFVLHVSPAVPIVNGQPEPGAVTAAPGGPARHLLTMRHVADVKVDSEEEIARVMADVESFAPVFRAAGPTAPAVAASGGMDEPVPDTGDAPPVAPAATPTDTPAPASATADGGAAVSDAGFKAGEWARALVAARAAIGNDLAALTAVPDPLKALAPDVEALKTILRHFFTFDAQGRYYVRWAGPGRDPGNAAHLTAEYKRENVRELELERDRTYLYAVLPEGLLASASKLDPKVFREIVVRFDETGDDAEPFVLRTLHTARWRRNGGPHEDFVFFYAEEGIGPSMPSDLRAKMAPTLQTLLRQLAEAGANVDKRLDDSAFTVKQGDAWYIVLSAFFDGQTTVPEGVLADDTDGWAVVQTPPDRVLALAALPTVRHLEPIKPGKAALDLSRAEVNFPGLQAKITAANRGGAGVVVGIIDTGIDGSHPAFTGRIHSVWDQDKPALVTGKTPKANHPGNDAYKLMDFGVELTKTSTPQDVTHAQDTNSHGTHVAGIAAGAEVKDAAGKVLVPAGYAPNATIVAVRAIANAKQSNWLLGVDYVFNKAKELGMPCVINMSFGHQDHAHDGSDPSSLGLFAKLTDKRTRAYLPGRIVIAAAGNERRLPNATAIHAKRVLPEKTKGGHKVITAIDLGTNLNTGAGEVLGWDKVIAWIKNPLAACPASFPIDVFVYRWKGTSTYDITTKVRLGDSGSTSFSAVNTRITVSSQLSDTVNGDFHVDVLFESLDGANPMTLARWYLMFVNGSDKTMDVHLWLPRGKSSFADFAESDRAYLVGAPAASAAAVSVASSSTRVKWTDSAKNSWVDSDATLHEISPFSSLGPLREASFTARKHHGVTHEVTAVDVTAPGSRILAALSKQAAPAIAANPSRARNIVNDKGMVIRGTSMASPAITGLVANLLAEEPKLTMPDVLNRLRNAASVAATSKFQPKKTGIGGKPFSDHWGYGLVDAARTKP